MQDPAIAARTESAIPHVGFDDRRGLPAPKGRNWFSDFEFGPHGVLIKKTGWRAPYSLSNILSVRMWFAFFFRVMVAKPIEGAPFRIHFAPDRARPWYMIWPVVKLAGGRIVQDAQQADVLMHFEDATFGDTPPPLAGQHAAYVNFGCRDVSKSKVAAAFEAAFGYPLALDPRTHTGPAVEKCELNGAHDGRIVQCPAEPLPGRVYQRVIDNTAANPDLVEDYRSPTVGGRPVCVFMKRRAIGERFANANSEVEMKRTEECFSPEELARISDFCTRMNLDFGGLDILRDRADGRLYIVDANKTDMGPPIALPIPPKLMAVRMIARAFRELIERR